MDKYIHKLETSIKDMDYGKYDSVKFIEHLIRKRGRAIIYAVSLATSIV